MPSSTKDTLCRRTAVAQLMQQVVKLVTQRGLRLRLVKRLKSEDLETLYKRAAFNTSTSLQAPCAVISINRALIARLSASANGDTHYGAIILLPRKGASPLCTTLAFDNIPAQMSSLSTAIHKLTLRSDDDECAICNRASPEQHCSVR